MSNLALETLLQKREQLQAERIAFIQKSGDEIRELDEAIKSINGGNYYFKHTAVTYDDESSTYIKGTEDGI